jgi:hypothetical protein
LGPKPRDGAQGIVSDSSIDFTDRESGSIQQNLGA